MLITQISDSHIAWPQEAGSDRLAELRHCVDHVNSLSPQPDFVIHSGDIVHNGMADEYDKAGEVLANIKAPLYVIPGNRDNRQQMRRTFAHCLPDNCHPDFLQYQIANDDHCIIMLDSMSTDSSKGRLCLPRLNHFEEMLQAARGKRVTIFMHHPPFKVETASPPHQYQFEDQDNLATFADILSQHSNIQQVYCGHSHRIANGHVASIPACTITSTATDLRMDVIETTEQAWPTYNFN